MCNVYNAAYAQQNAQHVRITKTNKGERDKSTLLRTVFAQTVSTIYTLHTLDTSYTCLRTLHS